VNHSKLPISAKHRDTFHSFAAFFYILPECNGNFARKIVAALRGGLCLGSSLICL